MNEPKHLASCPSCGCSNPKWKHNGSQLFPAKYAQRESFRKNLAEGLMKWYGEEFGYELYTCSQCESTSADYPH